MSTVKTKTQHGPFGQSQPLLPNSASSWYARLEFRLKRQPKVESYSALTDEVDREMELEDQRIIKFISQKLMDNLKKLTNTKDMDLEYFYRSLDEYNNDIGLARELLRERMQKYPSDFKYPT